MTGDQPLSRGQLHYLLTNPTYRGLIRHEALRSPGLHSAIVDEATWDRVRVKLQATSGRKRGGGARAGPGDPHA